MLLGKPSGANQSPEPKSKETGGVGGKNEAGVRNAIFARAGQFGQPANPLHPASWCSAGQDLQSSAQRLSRRSKPFEDAKTSNGSKIKATKILCARSIVLEFISGSTFVKTRKFGFFHQRKFPASGKIFSSSRGRHSSSLW
jgi:hypothetical protein